MKFIQKICNWYFTNHTLSYRFILFLDLSIVALTAMTFFIVITRLFIALTISIL